MNINLSNKERTYLGLKPVESNWESIHLNTDSSGVQHILFFENDILRKVIISEEHKYLETEYHLKTRDRKSLLPRTKRGKEKPLTIETINKQTPIGFRLVWKDAALSIINNHDHSYYYSTLQEGINIENTATFLDWLKDFVEDSTELDLAEIAALQSKKRKNISYKNGAVFTFKIKRRLYGFAKVLLDIEALRQKRKIPPQHGLSLLMGMPLLIKVYAYTSRSIDVDLGVLEKQPFLPPFYMFDQPLRTGKYTVIGHSPFDEKEFAFPISFGASTFHNNKLYSFTWGLIHLEFDLEKALEQLDIQDGSLLCSDHIEDAYLHHQVWSDICYTTAEIEAMEKSKIYDFHKSSYYRSKFDLRNPGNQELKKELFKLLNLDTQGTYADNCRLLKLDPPIAMMNSL